MAVLLLVGYLTQLLLPSTRRYLCLVPGRSIPCIWNVVTAGFLETSLLKLLLGAFGILMLAKVLEPVWGSKEFLKFVLLVDMAVGVSTLSLLYLLYVCGVDPKGKLLYAELGGSEGIIAGCLVAVKQLMPENEVTLLGFIRFRAKLLPSLFVVLAVVAGTFLGSALSTVPFVCFGTCLSWIYLRFLQPNSELNLRGDILNDDFRFATFFPEIMHPIIDKLTGAVGKYMCFPKASTDTSESLASIATAQLPESEKSDAARRRERGARALEERLGAKKAAAMPASADGKAPSEAEGAAGIDAV
ncbi:hypothetical protein WJX81_000351 [Elliptochloris bilobata]|uniref:Uncharacterized protein n=1 Tax=Elliptochloris bilobata TaxID=381761 RepID=A0AAW1SHE1_9CHLO